MGLEEELDKRICDFVPVQELIDKSYLHQIGLGELPNLASRVRKDVLKKMAGGSSLSLLFNNFISFGTNTDLAQAIATLFFLYEGEGVKRSDILSNMLPQETLEFLKKSREYSDMLTDNQNKLIRKLSNYLPFFNENKRKFNGKILDSFFPIERPLILGADGMQELLENAHIYFEGESAVTLLGDTANFRNALSGFSLQNVDGVSFRDTFLACGLAMHSFYFDINTLLLEDFSLAPRFSHEKTRQGKEPLQFAQKTISNKRELAAMAKAKEIYLKEAREIIERSIYAPLAFEIYSMNLHHTYLLSGLPKEAITGVNFAKALELRDFESENDFRGYTEAIAEKQDIGARMQNQVNEIYRALGDSDPLYHYLELFTFKPVRENSALFTSSGFTGVYIASHQNGWGKEFISSINDIADVLDSVSGLERLKAQKTGSLVELLKNLRFMDYFITNHAPDTDYDAALTLYTSDEALFFMALPAIATSPRAFVKNLADISSKSKTPPSKCIKINDETIAFISSLSEVIVADNAISVLSCYEDLQNLVDLGATPFKGRLDDIDDKSALASWWAEHKSEKLAECMEYRAIAPYQKTPDDRGLSDNLRKLNNQQNGEFLLRLKALFDLPDKAYSRAVGLLARLKSPKSLMRRKDTLTLLRALSLASPSAWEDFADDVKKLDSICDFSKLLESSRYKSIVADEKSYERLSSLADYPGFTRQIEEAIGKLIEGGKCNLADVLMDTIDAGKVPLDKLPQIIQLYSSIEDFYAAPPESFISAKESLRESMVVETKGYDFTNFDTYVRAAGFEPAWVRAAIVYGFKLRSSEVNVGGNYTRFEFYSRNVKKQAEDNGRLSTGNNLNKMVDWLINENIILLHHGRTFKRGGLSLQDHPDESTPLMAYVKYELSRTNPLL